MSEATKRPDFILGAVLFAVGLYVSTLPGGQVIGPQLMMAGAGMMIGAIMAQDPEEIIQASARSVSGRDQVAPWRIIYGEPRVGGVITYMGLSGSKNTYLDMILTLSGHEVEAINDLYLDDVLVPISGIAATGKYAGVVWLEKNLGAINQTAFTNLIDRSRPQWQTEGVRFNGAGHYGITPTNTDLGTSTMTLEVLFRPRDTNPATIVTYGGAAGWRLEWLANRRLKFTDASGNGITNDTALDLNQAYQITVLARGAGFHMYRNAISDGSNGIAYDPGTGSRIMYVGSLDGEDEFFKGDIDLIRTFSDVRTQTEITDYQGIPAPIDDTTGNWNINEGSGPTASDNSGNANHITLVASWTSDHVQYGRANVYLRLKWSQKRFPNGIPNIAFDVQGKKVLDPSTFQVVGSIDDTTDKITIAGHGYADGEAKRITSNDTIPPGLAEDTTYWVINSDTNDFELSAEPGGSAIDITGVGAGVIRVMDVAWSENPTLCCLDYLMDPEYGLRVPLLDVDEASINAAASVCAEQVARETEPDENRYDCDGVIFANRTPQNNIERLLTAMGGQMTYVGGKWALYAAAWRITSLDLNEDDITSPIKVRTLIGRADNFNTVKGLYLDPLNNWEPTDYPEVTDAAYVAADGEVVYKDFGLEFTRSVTATQRLAKIFLRRIRNPITVALTTKLVGYQLQPPNTMTLSNDRFGWVDKEFEVSESQLVIEPDSEGAPVLGQRLTLRETGSSIYDWASSEEGDIPGIPKTGLPDPFSVFPPDNIVLASGTDQLDIRLDGTIFSRIKVSWDTVEDEFVLEGGHIDVQYRKSTDTAWNPTGFIPGDETFVFILDVRDGILYDIRIRSVNSLGVPSDWVQIDDYTVIGKTEPPEDVTELTAALNGELVVLDWKNVSDLDLAGYLVRYHTQGTPDWGAGFNLNDTLRSTSDTTGAVPPGLWTFLVKAIDTSGNESTNAVSIDLEVTSLNANIDTAPQADMWDGTRSNFIRHVEGVLVPDSQTLATDMSDEELWDTYVFDPFAISVYTAPEVVLPFAGEVQLYAPVDYILGPEETGAVVVLVEVRVDPDGGGYGSWQPIGGQATYIALKYQFRFTSSNSAENNGVFQEFTPTSDASEHLEEGANLTVANGGTAVVFDQEYYNAPRVSVESLIDGWGYPTGITTIGFTAHVSKDGSPDDGGSVNWEARNFKAN